jgi:hypothetical protein
MEVFEVHVTGDESIHAVAKELGVKTIAVELLRPDKSLLRTEHMTSLIVKRDSYQDCKRYVENLVTSLLDSDVAILRVKIESPYYAHYKDQSLYMESHFESDEMFFPTSRNARKQKLLATDREYDKERYGKFIEKYKNLELELCLYDSFVSEDLDWFQLY